MGRPKYRPATPEEQAAVHLPPNPRKMRESDERAVEAALDYSRIPAGWGSNRDPYDPLD